MAIEYRQPHYDLEASIGVAAAIASRGAGATVSNHELAALLDYSGVNNGSFLQRSASARLFGLIEGPAAAISATERAVRILHPDYPQTADRALLDAFRAVPLYNAFLEAYRGRELPDEAGHGEHARGAVQGAAEGRSRDPRTTLGVGGTSRPLPNGSWSDDRAKLDARR